MEGIDFKDLGDLIQGLRLGSVITVKCGDELEKFIQTHDTNDLSQSTCDEMRGIYLYYLKDTYRSYTGGKFLPNIFIRRD